MDLFHKKELASLKSELTRLKGLIPDEAIDKADFLLSLDDKIAQKNQELSKLDEAIALRKGQEQQLDTTLAEKNTQIIQLDDEILVQSFGLYRPTFDFANSDQYKDKLNEVRQRQKEMIKNNEATTFNNNWSVNGSVAKGRTTTKSVQKLILRAFNSECDELVAKVKYNNFDSYLKRIKSSCETYSKLGDTIMDVRIKDAYLNLKIEELRLAFEYSEKKQQEKEEQRAIREQMREEAKLQKEIEEERKKLAKEQAHYMNALEKLNQQISNADEATLAELEEKKKELLTKLDEVDNSIKDVDYREANARAGYVYIISNIGAFGENVYKIGMTRRLDPMERVIELGDASVPFNFDVHAMIFTEDAPALEAALHRAFENKKLNFVNQRREFFNVTLDEIKKVIRDNFDKTVEYVDVPAAEQYRVSLKMKQERQTVSI